MQHVLMYLVHITAWMELTWSAFCACMHCRGTTGLGSAVLGNSGELVMYSNFSCTSVYVSCTHWPKWHSTWFTFCSCFVWRHVCMSIRIMYLRAHDCVSGTFTISVMKLYSLRARMQVLTYLVLMYTWLHERYLHDLHDAVVSLESSCAFTCMHHVFKYTRLHEQY